MAEDIKKPYSIDIADVAKNRDLELRLVENHAEFAAVSGKHYEINGAYSGIYSRAREVARKNGFDCFCVASVTNLIYTNVSIKPPHVLPGSRYGGNLSLPELSKSSDKIFIATINYYMKK